MSTFNRRLWIGAVIVAAFGTAGAAVGSEPSRVDTTAVQERGGKPALRYEDDTLSVRIVMRTPDQLTAFYLGRGFNRAAIAHILETCFITPIVHNKTLDVLWLRLDDWRFTRGDIPIARLKRDYWSARWAESGLPLAHQATFGWTLLPEERDLRPDEGAGGSVVIPFQDRPFTLTMRFHTGADKQGPVKTVVFEDLQCTTNPS